jgi:hypothetical protein
MNRATGALLAALLASPSAGLAQQQGPPPAGPLAAALSGVLRRAMRNMPG